MLVTEVVTELKNSNKFDVRDVEYNAEEDKAKYGKSFEALANKDFNFIKVNDVTFKAKRIIEEYGLILFIYNGNQVEVEPSKIMSLVIE